MKCPNCHACPFERGVCERLANRGRRFFLMGALALPVAAKIARVAPAVVEHAHKVTSSSKIIINGHVWEYADDGYQRDGRVVHVSAEWAVAI